MGRPIKKAYLGNSSTSGQQIVGNAWVAGDTQPRSSYIVKQRGTSSYVMASTNGNGPAGGGLVTLVNGNVTQAGQGNIVVTPYGATGNGAVASANLGISGSPAIAVSGTGAYTASYAPGEKLKLTGGTYTGNLQANVTVASVSIRTIAAATAGTSYAVGDYFIFSGAGYTANANVKVATVTAGAISTLTVVNPGTYTNSVLPVSPVTANVQVVSAGGSGATFNIGWGLNTVAVTNKGDYTVLPTNPVSTSGSVNGVGGTLNVTYSVSSVQVTTPGSGYIGAPFVKFSTGNASAQAVVNSNGNVSTVQVLGGGNGYTAIPNVSIVDSGNVQYARKITDRIVYTFGGGQYEWLLSGQTLPGFGYATISSQ